MNFCENTRFRVLQACSVVLLAAFLMAPATSEICYLQQVEIWNISTGIEAAKRAQKNPILIDSAPLARLLPSGYKIRHAFHYDFDDITRIVSIGIASEAGEWCGFINWFVGKEWVNGEASDTDFDRFVSSLAIEVSPPHQGKGLSSAMFGMLAAVHPREDLVVSVRFELTNKQVFMEGHTKGLSIEDAAFQTPLGKSMKRIGFTELKVVDRWSYIDEGRPMDPTVGEDVGKIEFYFSRLQ